MPEARRYLVGYRGAATVPAAMDDLMESLPARYPSITEARRLRTGQRVFEMDKEITAALKRECSELAVEEDQALEMCAPDSHHGTSSSSASDHYSWGRLALRADKVASRFTGKNIRVAVAASGAVAHENVKIAGGSNFMRRDDVGQWHNDEAGYGTHCCGIVSAQPGRNGTMGMAPEAEVFALKTMPGGTLSDLIEAIDWCVENYVDVIALGCGMRKPSAHVKTILDEARQHGITTVAAAGDTAGSVLHPAACSNVIAVSAIGRAAKLQSDGLTARTAGLAQSRCGQYYFAPFSNRGPEIQLCAPGVTIVSTVPGGYGARNGTAVACAFVAGVVALVLEASPGARTADDRQPSRVEEILRESAVDLGLPAEMQGAGMVNAGLALRSAFMRPVPFKKPATTALLQPTCVRIGQLL